MEGEHESTIPRMNQKTALPEPVTVVESIDRPPVFWNQNVTFVANLLGLFFGNEEQTRMLAEEVGEVDSYGGRLLPVLDLLFAGPGKNLLVLEREPDRYLQDFFAEEVGLSLPDIEVLPHREYSEIGRKIERSGVLKHKIVERLGRHKAERVDGYVTDDTLSRLAETICKRTFSTVEGSRKGNNKRLLYEYLEETGLPTPVTEIACSPEEVKDCLQKLERAGFESAVIKAAMGASGIGMTKVDSLADCDDTAGSVPEHFFTEGPCLIQGWLKPGCFGITSVRSPSVQLFLNEDSVTMFDITEQILSHESIHEGNESPPPYLAKKPEWRGELLRQASIAAKWLHSQGYRGTASADFLLVEKGDGGFEVYVCELNARVTGATYPSVLARHFMPDGAWLLRNLRFTEPLTGKELLDLLKTSNDLYIPGQSESGVFPLNFNFGSDGLIHKGQFLCLAPSSGGSRMLLNLAKLDLPCETDRD